MTLYDLLKLAQARLSSLNSQHAHAVAIGNIVAIERLEVEIVETQSTINALQSLS